MQDLKELEKYIKKNAADGKFDNVINGLILYADNDPAAPENVKLLNRTLKHVFWLAVLSSQKENDGKKNN